MRKKNAQHVPVAPYLNLGYFTGQRSSPDVLLKFVRRFGWSETFAKLAALAARMVTDPGGPTGNGIRSVTVDPLRSLAPDSVYARQIIDGLAFHDESELPAITAHEHVIYFLQALAILEGSDQGEPPNDVNFALMLLLGNDHVQGWLRPDARELSPKERLVAEFAMLARFNMSVDILRPLTRIAVMLDDGPARPPLNVPDTWQTLQHASLGRTFKEYMDSSVSPLIFSSFGWGSRDPKDFTGYTRPVFDKREWLSKSTISESDAVAFIDSISIDRHGAQVELKSHLDSYGLPRSVALFYRSPFVKMPNGNVAAASPWALREQLRAGIWAKFRSGSESLGPAIKKAWLYEVGILFEIWCRRIARHAAAYEPFKGHLLLSQAPGDEDEIEDVVIREGNCAALFSAKATLVREDVSRTQTSRTDVVDYYERLFFSKGSDTRGGQIRLLDRKIQRIRSGDFGDRLDPRTRLFPVVLTWDEFGENMALYSWIRDKCKEEGLLQQDGVASIALCTVDRFETLMAIAAKGRSIIELLKMKDLERWRNLNMDQVLFRVHGTLNVRLPEIEAAFEEVSERVSIKLFGKSLNPQKKQK